MSRPRSKRATRFSAVTTNNFTPAGSEDFRFAYLSQPLIF